MHRPKKDAGVDIVAHTKKRGDRSDNPIGRPVSTLHVPCSPLFSSNEAPRRLRSPPGGGLAEDGRTWVRAKADFLVHVKPLAALFRAKLRFALRQTGLWSEIPATAWQQPWVVDCRPVGTARAALKYLAPYIFRVALSNNRIVRLANEEVTFRYTVGATKRTAYCTLPVLEFLHRFLQHILPKGFVKVRYYGLFRVGMRRSLAVLRSQLQLLEHKVTQTMPTPAVSDGSKREMICPNCGQLMTLEWVLLPRNRGPPFGSSSTSGES
jgi:hypothetical protein